MYCRFCGKKGIHSILNLGHQPFSNSFLTKEQLNEPETYHPLELVICDSCWLVQIKRAPKASEIFKDDYVYHSSQSPANVSHAKEYTDMITKRFGIKSVVEIGSNDGYMLQHFKEKGINVLGVDPATECANEAIQKGIPTLIDFFSRSLARRTVRADLICGINVLAHQPDINDFVSGLKYALNPGGIITFEFPHLKKMIDGLQFDTVYHEHYYYFSLMTIMAIFERHLLEVFDVDEIPEHGGSLRIYARHKGDGSRSDRVAKVLKDEEPMRSVDYYADFQRKVNKIYYDFVNHAYASNLIAYGAAAKANTFINYCRLDSKLLPFVVDRSPFKQGKFLPGSHIPVFDEEMIKRVKPEYVLITAWNLKEEIMKQLSYIRSWNGKFVVAIPRLEIL